MLSFIFILKTMIDLTKSTRVWSVEDVNEYTYFSSHSPEHVVNYINNSSKVRNNDEAYLVCEYESSRAIVPDDVKTVRTFLLMQEQQDSETAHDISQQEYQEIVQDAYAELNRDEPDYYDFILDIERDND